MRNDTANLNGRALHKKHIPICPANLKRFLLLAPRTFASGAVPDPRFTSRLWFTRGGVIQIIHIIFIIPFRSGTKKSTILLILLISLELNYSVLLSTDF